MVGFEIETSSVNTNEIKLNDDETCEILDTISLEKSTLKPQKLVPEQLNKLHMTYEVVFVLFFFLFFFLIFSKQNSKFFQVVWQQSDIPWASRWDSYLKMSDVKIHWFSIINSLVVVFFLAGILSMILIRSLRRDIAKYNREDEPVFKFFYLLIRACLWHFVRGLRKKTIFLII